jgi:hypothetical protein
MPGLDEYLTFRAIKASGIDLKGGSFEVCGTKFIGADFKTYRDIATFKSAALTRFDMQGSKYFAF